MWDIRTHLLGNYFLFGRYHIMPAVPGNNNAEQPGLFAMKGLQPKVHLKIDEPKIRQEKKQVSTIKLQSRVPLQGIQTSRNLPILYLYTGLQIQKTPSRA